MKRVTLVALGIIGCSAQSIEQTPSIVTLAAPMVSAHGATSGGLLMSVDVLATSLSNASASVKPVAGVILTYSTNQSGVTFTPGTVTTGPDGHGVATTVIPWGVQLVASIASGSGGYTSVTLGPIRFSSRRLKMRWLPWSWRGANHSHRRGNRAGISVGRHGCWRFNSHGRGRIDGHGRSRTDGHRYGRRDAASRWRTTFIRDEYYGRCFCSRDGLDRPLRTGDRTRFRAVWRLRDSGDDIGWGCVGRHPALPEPPGRHHRDAAVHGPVVQTIGTGLDSGNPVHAHTRITLMDGKTPIQALPVAFAQVGVSGSNNPFTPASTMTDATGHAVTNVFVPMLDPDAGCSPTSSLREERPRCSRSRDIRPRASPLELLDQRRPETATRQICFGTPRVCPKPLFAHQTRVPERIRASHFSRPSPCAPRVFVSSKGSYLKALGAMGGGLSRWPGVVSATRAHRRGTGSAGLREVPMYSR